MPDTPRRRFDPEQLISRGYAILPGAALALVIGAASHRLLAEWIPVSSLLIALVAGMLLRTAGWVPWWGEEGLKWSAKLPLRVGIVLLGLQLAMAEILSLGWEVLVIVVATTAVTFVLMRVIGPLLRADATTAALLATGTSICGASAVAAAAAVLDRGDGHDRQGRPLAPAAAAALAVVTLCGTVAMVALPLASSALGLGEREAGVWIGASVHEVAQVVAAGGMVGATALAVATVVKLARVVLLAPAVLGLRVGLPRTDTAEGAARPPLIPWFVIGFLAAVVLNSLVTIPADTADLIGQITTMLLTIAMAGVGTAVNLRTLGSTAGPALLLGAVGSLIAAGTALAGVALLL